MKRFVQRLLANLARQIIKKYNPKIIGITGSVGKTTTRHAVFLVVSQKMHTYTPSKNYNNEFGLPFGIIGTDSPNRSLFKWLALFSKAIGLILFRQQYPEALVLEYGVDNPGDMDYLISIARPNISIITNIGISHYEFFKDVAAVEAEKGKLAECLTQEDWLVVSADNSPASAQRSKTKAHVLDYGFAQSSGVHIERAGEQLVKPYRTALTIRSKEKVYNLEFPALGHPHSEAIAASIAVATILNIDERLVANAVAAYKPVPGRLNVIDGIKNTVILDDSYNASPASVIEALNLFKRFPQQQKMIVLGNMLELGALTEQKHIEVGQMAADLNPYLLVTVGEFGRIIARGAKMRGLPEAQIINFDTSDEARLTVQDKMIPESAVLIKGSQGIRMEKIVKEVMANPEQAPELLCRQYGKWLI